MTPLSFAVLGYGRFGAALVDLLLRAGHRVAVFDDRAAVPSSLAADSVQAAVADVDWIVLAMPVPRMRAALETLRPWLTLQQTVMDVGSVKVGPCQWLDEVLGHDVPHVGTHPLFGPLSLARGERPRRVALCPSPRHPDAAVRAAAIFQDLDCEVVWCDAAEHDRMMADTHALAFFIAKALVEMGIGEDLTLAPPSFRGLATMIAAVRGDAGHLFAAIQQENPYAATSRARFLAALASVHARLDRQLEPQQLAIPEETESAAQTR